MQLVCDCLGLLHFSTGNTPITLKLGDDASNCQPGSSQGQLRAQGFCGKGEVIFVYVYRSLRSNFIRCFSLIYSLQLSCASIWNDFLC